MISRGNSNILAFAFILLLSFAICQENPCKSKMTCSECITASGKCGWLKTENNNILPNERCQIRAPNSASEEWINPEARIVLIKDKSLSEPRAEVEEIVQLYPQEVSVKLRINSPEKLTIKFRQAEDYPVDLYFLMDLSNSMRDDKDKLANLGGTLGKTMNDITKNYRLGFGSFVDKRAAPFVSSHPQHLISPCGGDKCASPYSFINHMPLSKDPKKFVKEVSKSKISKNMDSPESGFDAIMQVAVCHEAIQWRNVSRKILLVATDDGYHFAGDGKLAGIIIPNDEKCHIGLHGNYTEGLNMDYPSIAQINKKVVENNLNVIFAATSSAFPIYENLQKSILGSSAGRLAESSANIVDLVAKQYQQISSSIELKHNAPNNVKVTFYSQCLDFKTKEKTKECKGLKVKDQVEFDVEFEVNQCPKDLKSRKITFEISPVGLGEFVTVHLELLCECDCKKENNSITCTGVGTYECGVCNCHEGKFGQFCSCQNEVSSGNTNEDQCKQGNSSLTCNGRGDCKCDQCICHRPQNSKLKVYGTYCECDNFNCAHSSEDLICGGSDRGVCDCGKCICAPGWTGEKCDCRSSEDFCRGLNGELCSNVGNCTCGKCQCPFGYNGEFCEKQFNPAGKCKELALCAQCAAFQDENKDLDCKACTDNNFLVVEKAEVTIPGEYLCQSTDDYGCNFYFVYLQWDEGRENNPIKVQKTKECPKPADVAMIVGVATGSVLFIGLLLLLLWKILTSIYDKREYSKFLTNCENAKWDRSNNPIYKGPRTTFANPMYDVNSS